MPEQTVYGDADHTVGHGLLPKAEPASGKNPLTAIRACRKEDLVRIAEIHKSQFCVPGALLGELSPALIAAMYETFIDQAVFLVHESNGAVDGFVVGGAARELVNCRMSFLRHCGLWCMLDVLLRPRIWLLAFRSFAKLIRKLLPSKSGAASKNEFRLLSIAVAADTERQGVGTQLVDRFEEAIGGSCRAYRLGVMKSNSAAIRFYERLGFRYVGESSAAWTLCKALPAIAATNELRPP